MILGDTRRTLVAEGPFLLPEFGETLRKTAEPPAPSRYASWSDADDRAKGRQPRDQLVASRPAAATYVAVYPTPTRRDQRIFMLQNFKIDGAALRNEHRAYLADVASWMNEGRRWRVFAEAHASRTGSRRHDDVLSEDRYLATRAYLETELRRRGVNLSRVRIAGEGVGFRHSPLPGEDPQARSVYVVVQADPSPNPPQAWPPTVTPVFWHFPVPHVPTPKPAGSGGSVIEPFPTAAPTLSLADNASLKRNATLDAAMAARAADATTGGLCAAVVDLRAAGGSDGLYQGFNDDDMLYVGSLQKISAMYAAFELRDRVQQHVNDAVAHGSSTNASDWLRMQLDLKAAWQPKLDAAFPGLPSGFPKLGEIFTFSAGLVKFSSSGQTIRQLDAIGQGSVQELKFLEWLKLMMRWSNNHAASSCILALSYPYINGVLRGAGFFDRGSPGPPASPPRGLWISGNYVELAKNWLPDRTANDARAGQPKTARWFAPPLPNRPKTNFAATARQVARMMALIGLDKLVDAQSCREMRDLMSGRQLNRPPAYTNGTGSFLARALFDAHRPFDEVWGKIGIGDDGLFHDCGIVERTVAGTKFRYAIVGLGAPRFSQLTKLFVEIDKGM